MARTGRPKAELVLTDEERTALERLVRRRKSAQAMAMRARIVLRCADGLNNREVAEELGVSDTMVGKLFGLQDFKIDFAAWLRRLKRSKRQVALRFVAGDTPSEVANHFRLTRPRISQLRQELRQNWAEFQGELHQSAEFAAA